MTARAWDKAYSLFAIRYSPFATHYSRSAFDAASCSCLTLDHVLGLGNAGANPAAAPATVTGEICGQRPLRRKPWEGGRGSETREPGDLPCAVVLFPVGVRRGLAGETAVTARGAVHGGFRDSHLSKRRESPRQLLVIQPGERHAQILAFLDFAPCIHVREFRRRHGNRRRDGNANAAAGVRHW